MRHHAQDDDPMVAKWWTQAKRMAAVVRIRATVRIRAKSRILQPKSMSFAYVEGWFGREDSRPKLQDMNIAEGLNEEFL